MDKTDRLRDYGLAFLLYEQGLGICGYELIRELFIFIKLILNSYLDPSVMEDAKACYNRRCKDVNVWDWCVLYGRMSLNTKDHEGRINACNVFLSNGIKACFMPTYM